MNRFELICQSESGVVTVISSVDCQLQNHVDRPRPVGWIGRIEMPLGKVIVCGGPMDTMSFVCMLTNMRIVNLCIIYTINFASLSVSDGSGRLIWMPYLWLAGRG